MAVKLDGAAFERLLEVLGPEREQAARHYEELRRNLLRFFEWRGCADPPALTDEVIDRVARRLVEGETIRATDPGGYFLGVARNVWREELKRAKREWTGVAEAASTAATAPGELAGGAEAARDAALETALVCLDRCLDGLPPETRGLVLQYYEGEGVRRIDRRRRLAETLAIEPGALRIRMLRLRERLERCVEACLEGRPVTEGRIGTPADGGRRS
jgi:DNA-directed RNA polymerase specialized sigma24 family protein